jgi:signal transduction histidine kinase/ActR/RegA family two-component response regulator
MTNGARRPRRSSGWRLVASAAAAIFISEALAFLLLVMLPPMPLWGVTLVGASVSFVAILPILLAFVGRPLDADIEQRERDIRVAQDVEAQLRATLDSTADGILAVDDTGKILHANRRFAELWRIPQPLVERGDDAELIGFVLEQLKDPGAFVAKVKALYGTDAVGMDILQFIDGRVFERFSVPMLLAGARVGRVWSFRDVTEAMRTEHERSVMQEIAQGVATSSDLDGLLSLMHRSLQQVIAAENCFVALHDVRTGMFSFPYFADLRDAPPTAQVSLSKSCTAYVFRHGAPLLLSPGVFTRLNEQREVEMVGSPAASWMGVPLRTPSGTIGVLVIQDYDKANAYTDRDLAFLASVGSQFAVVIERKLAEESLRASERRLREAQRVAGVGSWELDITSQTVIWSESLSRMVGRDPALPAPSPADLPRYYTAESWERLGAAIQQALTTGIAYELDLNVIGEDGAHWWQTARGEVVRSPAGEITGLHGTVLDITARRQAEQAAADLEGQLQQAQKMETVGRLAGGVAHDFNNMLGVIIGHTEMALSEIDPALPLHGDLTEIQKAARRSADLTKQLLAYARKQRIVRKRLDMNTIVPAVLTMLHRVLGENVELQWTPAPKLWAVSVDQSQLEQLLTNLCVNARDAIAYSGTVEIATANVVIDEKFCAAHADAEPGDYVRLSVVDDGRGIGSELLPHLFEPFFTTKKVGEGTGLGLATVYGAVRQNDGFITVASTVGRGTRFDVYFPRSAGEVETARIPERGLTPAGGSETILVVEDEPTLLQLTAKVLTTHGYTVLSASGPDDAMRLATEHSGEIDLLLTDVVMPGMNGRELVDSLVPANAQLKYLFMSGFSEHSSLGRDVLADEAHFIGKPFAVAELTAKVRELLDNEEGS